MLNRYRSASICGAAASNERNPVKFPEKDSQSARIYNWRCFMCSKFAAWVGFSPSGMRRV